MRFTPPGGPELNLEGRVMWVNPYRAGSSDHRRDTVGGPVRVGIAARRGPCPYRLDPA